MDERLREILGDEEAWVVGGAVRDRLLLRPVLDIDVACADPRDAAHRFARPLRRCRIPALRAARRVARGRRRCRRDGRLHAARRRDRRGSRVARLHVQRDRGAGRRRRDVRPARRARRPGAGVVRAVSESAFVDDPLRLLRAVRFEDELGFRMDERTEELLRASIALVTRAAGERVLTELERLSPAGYRRLDEVGAAGAARRWLDERLDAFDRSRLPPCRRLRREPLPAPDLERARALPARAAPRAAPGGSVAALDSPLPPSDRALGDRRARVRRRTRARRSRRGGSTRRSDTSHSSAATSSISSRARRSDVSSTPSTRSGQRGRSRRARRRWSWHALSQEEMGAT